MVIVNRKSVFSPLPVHARTTESAREFIHIMSLQRGAVRRVARGERVSAESFSLGAAVFPRSFARILHPRKASATAKSLSFTYRARHASEREKEREMRFIPRSSRAHFSMRIRHYSNNLLPLFGRTIIRTTILARLTYSESFSACPRCYLHIER